MVANVTLQKQGKLWLARFAAYLCHFDDEIFQNYHSTWETLVSYMDFFRSSDHISAGVCCPNAPCTSMYIHVRYLFIRRTRIILLVVLVVFCPMTSPSVPHFVYHIPWWNPSFWLQPPKFAQIDVVGCLLHDIPMYPGKLVIQTHHSDGFVWEFVFSLWTSHLWDIPIYLDIPHFQTDILP